MSIKPKWCAFIASGKKTVEIRETKPKLEPPFKCYIYCTKEKTIGDFILCKSKEISDLFGFNAAVGINKGFANEIDLQLKGNVIGEFICDEITDINEFYGWHISALKIYDNPKELSEFRKYISFLDGEPLAELEESGISNIRIKKAPQSWRYVEGVMKNEQEKIY